MNSHILDSLDLSPPEEAVLTLPLRNGIIADRYHLHPTAGIEFWMSRHHENLVIRPQLFLESTNGEIGLHVMYRLLTEYHEEDVHRLQRFNKYDGTSRQNT